MKKLGNKNVMISSLELPGDMDKRVASEKVQALAKDFESLCNIHVPVVRKMGSRLVLLAGRDRVAAFMKLGHEKVEVSLVDCDDLEAEQVEVSENLKRRSYDPDERAAMDEKHLNILIRRDEAKDVKDEKVKLGPGRPKSPIRKARDKLAEKQGIKPDSIRRQQDRRRQKAKDKAEKQNTPPIEMFGREIDDGGEWLAQVEASIRYQKEASFKITLARKALGALRNANLPTCSDTELDAISKQLEELRHRIDEQIPTHLCPACKATLEQEEPCPTCNDTVLVGRNKIAGCPEELLDTENVRVLFNRKFVPIEEFDGQSESIFDED